jgi:branched-chain amino acid aminotransferase
VTHDARTALPAIWVDGTPLEVGSAHVSARDRGLTLADGLFETMLVRSGVVFRLDRHLARLSAGLAALGIPEPPALRDWIREALRGLAGLDAGLRLTVTRGVAGGGLAAPEPPPVPTSIVVVDALPSFPAAIYEAGIGAHVASGRRNERSLTAGLKTLAYVDAVAALREAQRAGSDEALLLDTEGHCSEATASNIFFWDGDTLLTPPAGCGALPGVTREAVLELAGGLGVPAAERVFDLDALVGGGEGSEAFLTSSLRGIVPLVRVNGRAIGAGIPGALTRRLTGAYTALVARECGVRTAQI